MSISDEEVIARFVVRARRVEAHSLVQDAETFAKLQSDTFTVEFATDGSGSTIRRPLPANEEIFESLAARVRPLVLKKEPIYYETVLDALERQLDAAPATETTYRERLDQLRAVWVALEPGQQLQVYEVWIGSEDGTESTGPVPDSQLGDGWMYADLVHADLAAWKQHVLPFPLQDRYVAAVAVYSRVAALAVATLRLVEELHRAGVVGVDEQVWNTDVVVGATEFVFAATAFIAPADTILPDLNNPFSELGEPWRQLTITEQLRRNRNNQVRVELTNGDGTTIAEYDSAVLARESDGEIRQWKILVAESLVFRIQLRVTGARSEVVAVDQELISDAMPIRLAANGVRLEMHQANMITFRFSRGVLAAFQLSVVDKDATRLLRQETELLEDVITIQQRAGQTIGPATRPLTPFERVRLRQIRLLWEGKIVDWDREVAAAVSPTGEASRWIETDAATCVMGGVEVPGPRMILGHPNATCDDEGPTPEAGPDARKFALKVPVGTRFLAWSPQTRQQPDEEEPQAGERWNLTGLDQDEFPL